MLKVLPLNDNSMLILKTRTIVLGLKKTCNIGLDTHTQCHTNVQLAQTFRFHMLLKGSGLLALVLAPLTLACAGGMHMHAVMITGMCRCAKIFTQETHSCFSISLS